MTGTVHVCRGRTQHILAPGIPGRIWTRCGKRWVARNVEPPATTRPMCKKCEAKT